ncbi:hypothetical protein M8C21_023113 [Ambrosia artemisiifolia]|uniref:SLC26A/SulP transporter domain-containing protein n=1 Tax=Ambrosia artemisiifolia TaxID=4212 RepID=A0AAD5D2C8_AMBAR|nr:hypothetical protein M8C21_023113 [Ambrosia artemisiifolia]
MLRFFAVFFYDWDVMREFVTLSQSASNLRDRDVLSKTLVLFRLLYMHPFMGSSRDIAIGPVALVSLLLGSMLRDELGPTAKEDEYLRLAYTATFFAGVTQAALGFFKLGFLIDFLSHATIVEMNGDELLVFECDVLVPCTSRGVVTRENAGDDEKFESVTYTSSILVQLFSKWRFKLDQGQLVDLILWLSTS